MNSLKNKVAIVTGASSGIGRATALLFARMGASVVVGARRESELNLLVDEIEKTGGRAVAVVGDAKDESFAVAMVQRAMDAFGGLDIAFNNAGTLGEMSPTTQLSATSWLDTINTNLSSAFYGAKHQIPAMLARGAGSVIFTSTFVGYTAGFPGVAAYAASKAGLIGLTQSLATEFGPANVRVNAILPGGTDTPMGKQMTDSPEALSYVENLHALKRLAKPEEIAQSVLHLASDASSFMTGAAMLVDGGISINRS
ncbi:MAG: SDR family oxidoreductase [Burkholderiales bacterium]|nr:SDR family oxidoreductase [Burkholderiales bacterium]